MATDIEELKFRLRADSKQLQSELKLVERKGSATAKKLRKSFSALTVATRGLLPALGGAVLVGAVRNAIEFGDAIQKASDKTGFAVETLQELRFAAQDAAGLGSRQTDTALQRFARRVGEAAKGTGVLKKELERYKIELRDGNGRLRSTMAILRDYADAVQGAENSNEQLRLAVQAFDQEGGVLVNVLRKGSDGLDEFATAARNAGAVIDEKTIASLSRLESKIETAQARFKAGFTRAVGGGLGFIIQDELDKIEEAKGKLEGLRRGADNIQERLDITAKVRESGFFSNLPESIRAFSEAGEKDARARLGELRAMIAFNEELIRFTRKKLAPPAVAARTSSPDDPELARRRREAEADAAKVDAIRAKERLRKISARESLADAERELDQQEQLAAALANGTAQRDKLALSFKAENAAKREGLGLDSEIGRQFVETKTRTLELAASMEAARKKSEESFKAIKDIGVDAVRSLSDALADFALDGELSFDRVGRAFARNLLQQGLNAAFTNIGTSLFGGSASVGASPASAVIAKPSANLAVPAASAFVPRGGGGAGERVAPVVINVTNAAGAQVSTSERKNALGQREVNLLIEKSVNDGLQNGAFDGAMGRKYGLRPVGI